MSEVEAANLLSSALFPLGSSRHTLTEATQATPVSVQEMMEDEVTHLETLFPVHEDGESGVEYGETEDGELDSTNVTENLVVSVIWNEIVLYNPTDVTENLVDPVIGNELFCTRLKMSIGKNLV